MRLYTISLNNLRRRKGKTIFLVLGLMIGIATIVTLITLTKAMEEDVGKKLDELGANIVITPKSHDLNLSYGDLTVAGVSLEVIPLRGTDISKIYTIRNRENISIVAPKLIVYYKVNKKEVPLAGVIFKEELRLKKWWRLASSQVTLSPAEQDHTMPKVEGRRAFTLLDSLEDRDVIVGAGVAQFLGLKEGQLLEIKGERFTVKGILEETGSQDDVLIFANLNLIQRIFRKGDEISLVEVAAFCNTCPIEEMVAQIAEVLPQAKVMAIKKAVESRMEMVKHLKRFSLGIGVIVVIIGSLIVFTTMMAQVNERTQEIGIFRAVGFRKRHIVSIILLEALIVGFVAGILGFLGGRGFSHIALPFFLSGRGEFLPSGYILAFFAVNLSMALAILASIYPALRAARLDPVEALRVI